MAESLPASPRNGAPARPAITSPPENLPPAKVSQPPGFRSLLSAKSFLNSFCLTINLVAHRMIAQMPGFGLSSRCVLVPGASKRGWRSLSLGQDNPPGSLSSDQIFSPSLLGSPSMGCSGSIQSLLFTLEGSHICICWARQADPGLNRVDERLALRMVELRL